MWLMFVLLFGLLALGVPIGVALGSSAVVYWLVFTNMNPSIVPAVFFEFINSYPLMAAPFFILAGMLMERSELLGQIFDFADSLLGWVKGGMGAAGFLTAVVFAALTGSAVAAASALSVIVVPRMTSIGHTKEYAAGLVCAGGTLAQLIPPSVWMIIYGVITETSVASLFFGGIIPGLILATLLIVLNLFLSRSQPVKLSKFEVKRVGRTFKYSLAGLGLPLLVLGGMYGGIFTPTEAGAAACAYAIIYGYIAKKGRFTQTVIDATKPAMKTTAMLFLLLGCVGIFQSLAANQYWPQELAQWALGLGLNKYSFLFLYMFVGLILGCFLDGLAIIALTVPVVYPIGMAMGVDPIHLCILLVINLQLGTITPPLGLNVYAVAGVTKLPVTAVLKSTMPFFFLMLAFMVIMIFTPDLSTWLPNVVVKPVHFGGLGG